MAVFFVINYFQFLQSLYQVDMKNAVKCWKDFLGYFNVLETRNLGIEKENHRSGGKFYKFKFSCQSPLSYIHNVQQNYLTFQAWTGKFFSVLLKFMYSENATKFCEIFISLLSYVVPVKSKVKISRNFVAFSEYMNFTLSIFILP